MGVADNFGEAFAKLLQVAAGQKLPTQGAVFISVTDHDKRHVASVPASSSTWASSWSRPPAQPTSSRPPA